MPVSSSSCFVDGPNIDMVLGTCILEHQPQPQERPRWDRVHAVLKEWYGIDKPCFVMNGDRITDVTFPFRRALRQFGYDTQAPRSADFPSGGDPVDNYILGAVRGTREAVWLGGHLIVLCAHDHGYAPVLKEALRLGGSVVILGFREEIAPDLIGLESAGAILLDLERDVEAFDIKLHRPFAPRRDESLMHSESRLRRVAH